VYSVKNLSDHGLGWWCILLSNQFDFFLELILANVIETSQFVDLSQSQLGFAQVTQSGLGVVLRNVLIGVVFSEIYVS
jgi:hypothetical protein